MASAWGSSWGSAWGNAWGLIQAEARRFAGGRPLRRGYIIRGRKFYFTQDELAQYVARLVAADVPIQREQIREVPKEGGKSTPLSVTVWETLVAPMFDDDDEEALMLLL